MKRDKVVGRIEHAARAGDQSVTWQLDVSHRIVWTGTTQPTTAVRIWPNAAARARARAVARSRPSRSHLGASCAIDEAQRARVLELCGLIDEVEQASLARDAAQAEVAHFRSSIAALFVAAHQ